MHRSSEAPSQGRIPTIQLLISTFFLTACAGDAPPEPVGYTVRDSAGITIVENTEPAWGEEGGWRYSPEPLLTIGVMTGPDEYTLYQVRTAMRLGDGRIVVVNSGSRELRFYDAQGTFLGATGSEGEGPGEFRDLGFTWRTDVDSLVAYDFRLRRFSVFDATGAFARNLQIGLNEGEFAYPDGVFGDGTILASVDEQDQGNYQALGFVQGRSRFGRYDGEGNLMATLASLPGSEFYKGTHPDGSGFTTSANHAVRPYSAAGTNTWFYGSSEAFEFEERGQTGELLKLIRLDRERRAMPETVRENREAGLREMTPQARELWGGIPLPDSLPTHEELMVDRVGNLWVKGYVVLEEEPYWSVFDTGGRWLGDLTPPQGLRITEVGEDYLMGIWADTLGVQQVQMYGLEKAGG